MTSDCTCRYKGVSLNSEVLQGPDYINRLHFVLLRFWQYGYALTADMSDREYVYSDYSTSMG